MPVQQLAEVTYARRGAAAWITLDRPAKRNALTPAMVGGLPWRQQLARHRPAQPIAAGAEDDRHPARADLILQHITGDLVAGLVPDAIRYEIPEGQAVVIAGLGPALHGPRDAAVMLIRTSPRPSHIRPLCASPGSGFLHGGL